MNICVTDVEINLGVRVANRHRDDGDSLVGARHPILVCRSHLVNLLSVMQRSAPFDARILHSTHPRSKISESGSDQKFRSQEKEGGARERWADQRNWRRQVAFSSAQAATTSGTSANLPISTGAANVETSL